MINVPKDQVGKLMNSELVLGRERGQGSDSLNKKYNLELIWERASQTRNRPWWKIEYSPLEKPVR